MALLINKTALVLVSLLLAFPILAEKKVYRYTNAQGATVINDTIPPEYVDKGYEVITYQGEVITVVPPQLTAEERRKRWEENEAQRQQAAERERLRQWDESLLLRYSTVDEIKQAKHRAIQVIDVAIGLNKSNVKRLKTDIEQQQAEAADIERRGEQLTEARQATLIAFKNELQLVLDAIERREQEKIDVAVQYDADIDRFVALKERLDTHQRKQAEKASRNY